LGVVDSFVEPEPDFDAAKRPYSRTITEAAAGMVNASSQWTSGIILCPVEMTQ
jgi:hypothetical protein